MTNANLKATLPPTCYIVVEGNFDKKLIDHLLKLAPHRFEAQVLTGGSYSGAQSLAQSLSLNGKKVALLIDSETTEPELIESRRQELEWALKQRAGDESLKVFLAQPELEVIFFQDKKLTDKLLSRTISDEDFVSGKFQPKLVLTRLLGTRDKILKAISKTEATRLAKTPPIKQLFQYAGTAKESKITFQRGSRPTEP